MTSWQDIKLKDVIHVINGRAYKKHELLSTGKYRVLRVGNFFTSDKWYYSNLELDEDKYCESGDLLYAWSASFGPKIWQEEKVIYHYHIWKMVCDESRLVKEFAYYFLNWDKDQITQEHKRGVGMFHLTKNTIENRTFPLPPLLEQKRIVSKLDGLFERIDQSIVLLEENLKHAQALMSSVLDEIYKEGDTPLREVVELNPKKSQVRGLDEELEVTFLPMAELNEFQISFEKKQTKPLKEVYKGYTYFQDDDVLLAKVTPCFENQKGGLAMGLTNGIGFGSSEYHVLRPSEKVIPEWIYYAIMSREFNNEGKRSMTGAVGLKRIPSSFVENWKIPIPSIEDQKESIRRIQAIFDISKESIKQFNQKLNNLKSLKYSLLDKAFKGEL